jgi:dipeptidyl aminopeptidase/acylaminoacyl peptidase
MISGGARAALVSAALVLAACSGAALHPRTGVKTIPIDDDVQYVESDGHKLRVDVYRPDRGGRHPAALVLHGSGGIHALAPSTVNRYAQALAEQGIVTFVVHYFDATGNFTADDSVEAANYFHWVRDLRNMVTWVRRRPDVTRNRISLVGHSLGAWLAVGAGAMDPRIYRMALFGSGLEPFLGDSITRMPPTLLFHGAQDDVVPLTDANTLVAFMRKRRYNVNLVVYKGESHTFSDSAASDALTRAARFIAPGQKQSTGR